MIGTERWDVARYRAYIAGSCVDATGVKTTPPRRRSLELDEQVRFFGFVDLLGERNPQLADALLDVYATANGGKRPRGEAGKLRDSGVRRGVPDIEIWIPCGGYHGMVIEMKALRSGRATPEQRTRIERLRARGYRAEICHGWIAAARSLCDYLSIAPPDDAEPAVERRLAVARATRKERRRERLNRPLAGIASCASLMAPSTSAGTP